MNAYVYWYEYVPLSVPVVANRSVEPLDGLNNNLFTQYDRTQIVTSKSERSEDTVHVRPPKELAEAVKDGAYYGITDGGSYKKISDRKDDESVVSLLAEDEWLDQDPAFVYVLSYADVSEVDLDPRGIPVPEVSDNPKITNYIQRNLENTLATAIWQTYWARDENADEPRTKRSVDVDLPSIEVPYDIKDPEDES